LSLLAVWFVLSSRCSSFIVSVFFSLFQLSIRSSIQLVKLFSVLPSISFFWLQSLMEIFTGWVTGSGSKVIAARTWNHATWGTDVCTNSNRPATEKERKK
jgi:hypothetical protein